MGKTAFVTGAGAGFGGAFARALAKNGANVVLADINLSAAQDVVGEIKSENGSAIAVYCDVADADSVKDAVRAAVNKYDGIDILINNAGLHSLKYNLPIDALNMNDINRLFDVNVMGALYCAVECRSSMRERGGGVIVNIASIAAYLCNTIYGVSKLAVRGLTVNLASEFANDNIRVNAIAPGLIKTDTLMREMPDLFEIFIDKQLIKRNGDIDDVVSAMLYLCGPESGFISGETLKVTGGYALQVS